MFEKQQKEDTKSSFVFKKNKDEPISVFGQNRPCKVTEDAIEIELKSDEKLEICPINSSEDKIVEQISEDELEQPTKEVDWAEPNEDQAENDSLKSNELSKKDLKLGEKRMPDELTEEEALKR